MRSSHIVDEEENVFAMELLMPFDLITKDISGVDLADDRQVCKLAERYRVPASVMSLRIVDVRAALERT